jgi:lipoyl synthase
LRNYCFYTFSDSTGINIHPPQLTRAICNHFVFLHGKTKAMMKHDTPEQHLLLRKPSWLKIKVPKGKRFVEVKEVVSSNNLHTICQSGLCPNKAECWEAGTATFMILGETCTRSCRFCATQTGRPLPPDPDEPVAIARAIQTMALKHAVVTSVDRDDLPDRGAAHWTETIRNIRLVNPETTLEVLIPDFDGNPVWIRLITDQKPDVVSHNLETVERLTPQVRSKANYRTSLDVIRLIAAENRRAKSGIMLGLGETDEEILKTMDDLLDTGCTIITLGQYLQPSASHLPVLKYYHPDEFERYAGIARDKGFRFVESAPLVRSSYHAEKHVC